MWKRGRVTPAPEVVNEASPDVHQIRGPQFLRREIEPQDARFYVYDYEGFVPIGPESGNGTSPQMGLQAIGPPSDPLWLLTLRQLQTEAQQGGPVGSRANPLLNAAWAQSFILNAGGQGAMMGAPGEPPPGWEYYQP
jgi:hypothetical protein